MSDYVELQYDQLSPIQYINGVSYVKELGMVIKRVKIVAMEPWMNAF